MIPGKGIETGLKIKGVAKSAHPWSNLTRFIYNILG
jgi:hypothetical protein